MAKTTKTTTTRRKKKTAAAAAADEQLDDVRVDDDAPVELGDVDGDDLDEDADEANALNAWQAESADGVRTSAARF